MTNLTEQKAKEIVAQGRGEETHEFVDHCKAEGFLAGIEYERNRVRPVVDAAEFARDRVGDCPPTYKWDDGEIINLEQVFSALDNALTAYQKTIEGKP